MHSVTFTHSRCCECWISFIVFSEALVSYRSLFVFISYPVLLDINAGAYFKLADTFDSIACHYFSSFNAVLSNFSLFCEVSISIKSWYYQRWQGHQCVTVFDNVWSPTKNCYIFVTWAKLCNYFYLTRVVLFFCEKTSIGNGSQNSTYFTITASCFLWAFRCSGISLYDSMMRFKRIPKG